MVVDHQRLANCGGRFSLGFPHHEVGLVAVPSFCAGSQVTKVSS